MEETGAQLKLKLAWSRLRVQMFWLGSTAWSSAPRKFNVWDPFSDKEFSVSLRKRVSSLNISTSQTAARSARPKRKGAIWCFVISPLHAFLNAYLRKARWKQGMAGLTLSIFRSYRIFVTHSKIWELQNGLMKVKDPRGRRRKRENKDEST